MAEKTPVENLQTLRSLFVEERRRRAEYGIQNDPDNAVEHIVRVQALIEGIDRAIDDEKKLAPSIVETRGLRM